MMNSESCPGPESKDAGKMDACEGCPNQGACSSGKNMSLDDVDLDVLSEKMQSVQHKILVLSGKGGVGKSTVTTTLAHLLSGDLNYDVGVLDLDICGPSLPRMLNLENSTIHSTGSGWSPVCVNDKLCLMSIGFLLPNKDNAIIWRGPKKNGIIKQFLKNTEWGQQDFLLIDTPPGTSDEHLSIVSMLKSIANTGGVTGAGAILVTTPQEVAIQDVRKQIQFCKKVNLPIIGIIENMSGYVCGNCNHVTSIYSATNGGVDKLSKDFGIPVLGRVPLDPVVAAAMDNGENFLDKVSDGNVALESYCEIIENIEKRLSALSI